MAPALPIGSRVSTDVATMLAFAAQPSKAGCPQLPQLPVAESWLSPVAQLPVAGLADSLLYPVYLLDAEHQRGASAILEASDPKRQVVLTACGQATATLIDSQGNRLTGFRPRMIEMVVTPGVPEYDADAMLCGELAADVVDLSRIDRAHYEPGPQTDEQGRITFPALIPGATYRLTGSFGGRRVVVREFTARSGETIPLGEIVIRR